MFTVKRALVISPHTDDGELCLGGTMAKLVDDKIELFHAVFSDAHNSLSSKKFDTLAEFKAANKILSIPDSNLTIYGYDVRAFNKHRQKILDDLILLRKDLSPDLVFLPSSQDVHQDHFVINLEGIRAFKNNTSILGYENPWNNLVSNVNVYVTLTDLHVTRKVNALKCYRSQKNRVYFNKNYIMSLMRVRGTQINVKYAESFSLIRMKI